MSDHDHRAIGLSGATLIGIGAIVGGGVLALAGSAFLLAGPAAILAFALNGLIAYLTAFSFAEMSTSFPENGAPYTFAKKVMNVKAAFATGWILCFASIAAAALYALGFAAHAVEAAFEGWRLTGGEAPAWLVGDRPRLGLAVLAIGLYAIFLVNRRSGGGAWESIGKVVLFGAIIAGGLWALRDRQEPLVDTLTPFAPFGSSGLIAAMGLTFITMQGFGVISAVGGEIRQPRRTIPRAMFIALGVALLIYLPLLFVVMAVGVPPETTLLELAEAHPETLIAVAAGHFLGPAGYWLVMAAAILSMLSAMVATMLAASRIIAAMAGDRTLPRPLGRLNRRALPYWAITGTAALAALIVLVMEDVATAGAAASLIFLISYSLTHLTCLLARRRGGGAPDAFRTPWFPLIPVVGGLCCFSLAVYQGVAAPAAGLLTAGWLLVGLIFYFTRLAGRARIWDARSEASDPELVRLRGRSPLVLVPTANPRHARAMVEVAQALAPPAVGRVLLLAVMTGKGKWAIDEPPPELRACQEVLGEALAAAVRIGISPEALVTMAPEPWQEILRVADNHRCESVLLGLSELPDGAGQLPLESSIQAMAADVVVMRSPPNWRLGSVTRILVAIGGAGGHDVLRARLLASLGRHAPREVTFLRVVAPTMPLPERQCLEQQLADQAQEESPYPAKVLVLPHADPVVAIAEQAALSDLTILGTRRSGRRKTIGPVAIAIARQTPGAIILISHRE